MNLTTDRWIPIVWSSGAFDKVSLLDAFLRGHEIRDLAVRPHERIALMRLLICITQAALDGPKDQEDWRECRGRIQNSAADYLRRWKEAFELFGAGQRFLQVRGMDGNELNNEVDSLSPLSKLDFALATGNNTTLFDNAGGGSRAFSPATQALMLLTFQNFSPSGRIGDVAWSGVSMGSSSSHAPCIVKSMLHGYVLRESLADTLHANVLTKALVGMARQAWGQPVWEQMPFSSTSVDAIANATGSYVGRLVPLSRTIRLSGDGRTMRLGAGIVYSQEWRESAATIVTREVKGVPGRVPLRASLDRAVWREAHSVAVLAAFDDNMLGGPLALSLAGETAGADVWCGALVSDPLSQAKLLDTIEAVLHIPATMLGHSGQRLYAKGVQHAELWGRKLARAVAAYRREYRDDLERPESRKRGFAVKAKAASHYWTTAEQRVPLLLAALETPAALQAAASGKSSWGVTRWGQSLARAALASYELACPSDSPRQLKAYALGFDELIKQVPHDDDPGSEETEE